MSSKRIVRIVIVVTILLLAYAWYDGGREPLHEISQDIALPEAAQ